MMTMLTMTMTTATTTTITSITGAATQLHAQKSKTTTMQQQH